MNPGAQMPKPPFMWGSFEKVPLAHIFGVLALCRQHVGVRFVDEEREVGVIAVKAGHVIGAEDFRTPARGANALKALIRDPGTSFSVTRLPSDAPEMHTAAVLSKLTDLFPDSGGGHNQEAPGPEPVSVEPEGGVSPTAVLDALEVQVPHREPEEHPIGDDSARTGEAVAEKSASSEAGEVILHGNASDISFEEFLQVLQLNPNHLRISFMRDRSEIGTLDLMSQQVIRTSFGSLCGREAFTQLYADHGETFEVRYAVEARATETLGSISQLLAEAQDASAARPVPQTTPRNERALFMEGRLTDIPWELLISSLDLSRQPIELELCRGQEILHRVLFKSGRIMAAESAGTEGGNAALAAIREDPGTEFVVYRHEKLADESTIAPLQALLPTADVVPEPVRTAAPYVGDPVGGLGMPEQGEVEQDGGTRSSLERPLPAADVVPEPVRTAAPYAGDPVGGLGMPEQGEVEQDGGTRSSLERPLPAADVVPEPVRTATRSAGDPVGGLGMPEQGEVEPDGGTRSSLERPLPAADVVPEPVRTATRSAGDPVGDLVVPVQGKVEPDGGTRSSLEKRLEQIAASVADLRDAQEAGNQAPVAAADVSLVLSQSVAATTLLLTDLKRTHEDALRDAQEAGNQAPVAAADVSLALSQSVAATTLLLTDLKRTHEDALREVREALKPARSVRTLLWFILALQCIFLVTLTGLLALVAI